MAKDIFVISVGCMLLSYTGLKIYEASPGDLPFASYARKIFRKDEIKISKFIEYDSYLETNNVIGLADSDTVIA